MKNKSLLIMLLILSASAVMAQHDTTDKLSNTQKLEAAKADVYIVDAKKKITDSFTTTLKDTTAVAKKSKKKPCLKRNKKSS